PNVDAGYGGWQEVARPRRRPLSVWQGSPGLRLSLPILLDQFAAGVSIERPIAQLESLALPTAPDGSPPRARAAAPGAAARHRTRTWVVATPTWAAALRNGAGDRVRQQVPGAFLEYIADVRVGEDSTAGRIRRQAARAKTKAGAPRKRVIAG